MPSHAAHEKSSFYQRQRMPAVPMDRHSTANRMSRVTRAGRKLTYVLTVIQQPERARACGSGAKSSSDRRPVDPPPVVELKIYHDDGPKSEHVTFAYEANFFLFVTLEPAPPTAAAGRSQPGATTPNPVLTGMPVSGMAYLDRPSEAGYFIFPDLSVRHEGQYVLSFNLYEETKNRADEDLDPCAPLFAPAAAEPDSSFDWRLEVKSAPFTVYSAKKFPGLTESTHLSRIVAEQGCRVRIRRDVRMRRRDHKSDEQTPHEEYSPYRDEKDLFRHRTRSRSLSPTIPDSVQTPTHADPFTVAPPPPLRSSFLDRSLAPLTSSSAMSPATRASTFHPPPASNYTHRDRPSYALSSKSLHPPRDSRDYPPEFRPSSALANTSPPSPPTLLPPPSNPPAYSSHSPHGLTSLPSLERRLLNPTGPTRHLGPPALCHPPIAAINLSPLDTSLYASSSLRKRPHDRTLPGPLSSNHLRLFHGQRPPTPDAHTMEPDSDAMGLEKPMTYKRASGAMRVRGPPIIS